MSNTLRWRYGDTNPVMAPVEAATEIQIGDLLFLDAGSAKPASSLSDQGSEALNQHEFQDHFLGVAMQASPAGASSAIRVATTGVFEFDCAAATFDLGDRIGASEDSGGAALENQTVKPVLSDGAVLGRCAKPVSPAGTRVLVDIVSTVMRGGPQVAA